MCLSLKFQPVLGPLVHAESRDFLDSAKGLVNGRVGVGKSVRVCVGDGDAADYAGPLILRPVEDGILVSALDAQQIRMQL